MTVSGNFSPLFLLSKLLAAIIDTTDAQLLPLQLSHGQSALPVYALMPKFHKPSLAFRFLSLLHTSRLKPAAVQLTRLLKAFKYEPNRMWAQLKMPLRETFIGLSVGLSVALVRL